MMKKSILILILPILLLGNVLAQNGFSQSSVVADDLLKRVGYINTNEILSVMPESVKATADIQNLNKKYKAELETMQNDYNKKYSDFISSQNTMAENIRLRRMQELHELEKHITAFMQVAQKDIETQEQERIHPLRTKLKETIKEVGIELRLICVYDLANPTIVFVTPDGIDITGMIKTKLGIK